MIALLSALASAAPPLAPGDYVLEVEMASETKLPFFGRARVTTTSWSAARVERDGDGLVLWQEPCAVSLEGGGPARTTFPDAFVAAFPAQRTPIVLTEDGEGWRFRVDPGPVCVGCEGGLPASNADALDWEGDGRPGGTIELRVPVFGRVLVYVAQYSHIVYEGHLADGGAEGPLRVVTFEQRTLGASHPGFSYSPEVVSVPEASGFRLAPVVGPDAPACPTLP